MTEQKEEPVARKATKEEREEASQIIRGMQETGEYSRYVVFQ